MTDLLDLPTRFREKLEALLREHVPDAEVWAYGSRVNGRSHDSSDLDLVLRGPTLQPLGGREPLPAPGSIPRDPPNTCRPACGPRPVAG